MVRSDHRLRRDNARLKRASAICHLCGEEIDRTLKHPHPLSWSADHVEPVALGGDMLGRRLPAHLVCNQRRGVGRDVAPALKTTREW